MCWIGKARELELFSADAVKQSSPAILLLLGMITIQAIGHIFGGCLISCSRNRLTRVRDNLLLLCVNREIFGLERFFFRHRFISA
jgi:hypothetical protein